MSTQRAIDVQSFINAHRLSAMQIVTLLLCFFIVAVDGFDTAASLRRRSAPSGGSRPRTWRRCSARVWPA